MREGHKYERFNAGIVDEAEEKDEHPDQIPFDFLTAKFERRIQKSEK